MKITIGRRLLLDSKDRASYQQVPEGKHTPGPQDGRHGQEQEVDMPVHLRILRTFVWLRRSAQAKSTASDALRTSHDTVDHTRAMYTVDLTKTRRIVHCHAFANAWYMLCGYTSPTAKEHGKRQYVYNGIRLLAGQAEGPPHAAWHTI